MVEIRWHARGGQGAVTASKILASSAIREGKYAQSNPDYGAERSGAPIRAYNRLSETPVNLHCMVLSPDVVVVVDPTLLGVVDVLEGIKEGGTVIVNTSEEPQKVKEKFKGKNVKVFTVDATKIAMEELKRPLVNIPMLGALVKVLKMMDIRTVEEDIRKTFGSKISEDMLNANIRALYRGYEEVRGE
jgi:pyruvate ferredoxin oxidoreductase gamma subunit